jgi:hypothetical protein
MTTRQSLVSGSGFKRFVVARDNSSGWKLAGASRRLHAAAPALYSRCTDLPAALRWLGITRRPQCGVWAPPGNHVVVFPSTAPLPTATHAGGVCRSLGNPGSVRSDTSRKQFSSGYHTLGLPGDFGNRDVSAAHLALYCFLGMYAPHSSAI